MNEPQHDSTQVTRKLCAHLAAFGFDSLPPHVVHAARRGVLDWIGCALAGSRHPTLDTLNKVLSQTSGKPVATVFGRHAKLGLLDAPLANGQAGHVLDYDDTHMGGTVLHTSSPTLAALFALAERDGATGRDFIAAYVAGFEAGVRTGQAAPKHHDGGWHLTGTLGAIAAGAAAGKLIRLDAKQMTHALGIAATQSAGMQQNRGTMCKSLHAGKAASSGVLAALLAQQGFDSSEEILEGKQGFCRIYSTVAQPERITHELGERWEIVNNGHKPYACGVVLHPPIDAMIELRTQVSAAPDAVQSVELCVHPHVVSITGVVEPQTGLQSKFSIYHSAAVAYLDGDAGIAQYTDERARDAAVVALRRKVKVTTDKSLRTDEARAMVTAHGKRFEAHIAHASGTVDNPMSDEAMERKFLANAEAVIGAAGARKVAQLVWRLEAIPDVRELTARLA
ncbi:MAG TPA: MmgE/PrpD family protein [Burkholderiales bacterium]|nr:MmgE/PrpD family protein [Burkholderiales bacterium]